MIDPMGVEFIILSKWILSWIILIYGRFKYRSNMWAYVEDEALWFRRGLGLNCKCTMTTFW